MEEIKNILSEEKIQDYYDKNNINGAIEEFSNLLAPNEFQELKHYIEIKSCIETYSNTEKEEEINKLFNKAEKKEIRFDKIVSDYLENEEEFINSYRNRINK